MMNILIVEDEFSVSLKIREMLEEEQNFCKVTNSAVTAMSLLYDISPNLMIVLIKRTSEPVQKSFLDLCGEARDLLGRRLRILIIAEGSDSHFRESAYIAGVDKIIDSGYSLDELKARIDVLFGRQRNKKNGAPIVSKRMILHPDIHKLYIKPLPDSQAICIDLTRKESALLRILMRNPNQVLERDVLINRVWGSEGGQSRSLDNYIQRIRAKVSKCTVRIKSLPFTQLDALLSVHSVGYAFIDSTGINAT